MLETIPPPPPWTAPSACGILGISRQMHPHHSADSAGDCSHPTLFWFPIKYLKSTWPMLWKLSHQHCDTPEWGPKPDFSKSPHPSTEGMALTLLLWIWRMGREMRWHCSVSPTAFFVLNAQHLAHQSQRHIHKLLFPSMHFYHVFCTFLFQDSWKMRL